jgi:hypothetical protein
MAVKLAMAPLDASGSQTKLRSVGVAFADTMTRELGVADFVDNDLFWNPEVPSVVSKHSAFHCSMILRITGCSLFGLTSYIFIFSVVLQARNQIAVWRDQKNGCGSSDKVEEARRHSPLFVLIVVVSLSRSFGRSRRLDGCNLCRFLIHLIHVLYLKPWF